MRTLRFVLQSIAYLLCDVSALMVGVWWLLRLLHVQYWPVHAACQVAICTVCICGCVDE
jgi:hypothetical protein